MKWLPVISAVTATRVQEEASIIFLIKCCNRSIQRAAAFFKEQHEEFIILLGLRKENERTPSVL